MTDYSDILPEDDKAAQILLSDTGSDGRSNTQAELTIREDGTVSLGTRTYYGGDGTPMDEWHRRTLVYRINENADAKTLRDELRDGQRLSLLIDRVIEGHSVEWNGSNHVGRLDDDAEDADRELETALTDYTPYSGNVASAKLWLTGGTQLLRGVIQPDDTAEDLLATAEGDGWLITDGLGGFEAAIEEAAEERREVAEREG
jgi:hypothetical protein